MTEDLISIQIMQGILHATYKQRQARKYTITNRDEKPRDVIIEHPKQTGRKLILD